MKNHLNRKISVQLLGAVALLASLQAPCQQAQESSGPLTSKSGDTQPAPTGTGADSPQNTETGTATPATPNPSSGNVKNSGVESPKTDDSAAADESKQPQTSLDELLKDDASSEATATEGAQPSSSVPDEAEVSSAPEPPPVATTPVPSPYTAVIHANVKDERSKPANEAESDRAPVKLEEIVVTATKREESVRKIPASITALTGRDLESTGARDLKDFVNLAPGVTFQDGSAASGGGAITIRGVGPSAGANQTTGALIGDVPMSDPYSTYVLPDLDPFDLQTVEILKGPQGTLFGASALNGLIRYVPNKPVLESWEGKGFAEWATVHEGQSAPTFGGAINVPVGSELAFRGTGVYQKIPGVYDDLSPGVNKKDSDSGIKWMGRALARWEPTDRLSINAFYLKQHLKADNVGFADNLNGNLSRSDTPGPSNLWVDFGAANLDARYEFDWGTLVSSTARLMKNQNSDVDGSYSIPQLAQVGIQTLREAVVANINGLVQEVRLVSPSDGQWLWLGGAFYENYQANLLGDFSVANTQILGALFPGLTTSQGLSLENERAHLVATERALFGEVTRKLGEQVAITLGARYYRTVIGGPVQTGGLLVTASEFQSNVMNTYSLADHGLSPKFAVTYQATDDILVYTNASRGYQFGGVNVSPAVLSTNTIPPTFKSSSIWSYELGVRTDWLENTLRFDLTGFYLNWTNPQISQRSSGLVATSYLDNVGAAKGKGLESTLQYLTPLPGLSISAAASYIVVKTAESYTGGDGRTVQSGTIMAATPKLQTSTTVAYTNSLGPWTATAAVIDSFEGKAYNNINHDFEIYNYNTINLTATISRSDLSFAPALTLVVNNLTDKRALSGVTDGGTPTSTDGIQAYYIRPRSISLRLSADF